MSVQLEKVQIGISNGRKYLEGACHPKTGFQSDRIGNSRNNMKHNEFPVEFQISLFALDLLGDMLSSKVKLILRSLICPDEAVYSPDVGLNGRQVYVGTLNYNKFERYWPDDNDDTSLYNYINLRDGIVKKEDHRVTDLVRLMSLNTGRNGCIQVYYPPMEEHRVGVIDEVILSNVLRFLYYYGIERTMIEKSEDHLLDWLVSGKYLNGTRYCKSPEFFLYFCAEAVSKNKKALARFGEPLSQQLLNRISILLNNYPEEAYPLDFSTCILALSSLKLLGSDTFKHLAQQMCAILVDMQVDEDNGEMDAGGWPADCLYKYKNDGPYLGSCALSTIFCVAALKKFEQNFYQDFS